jgi:hypothetical protein
MEPSVMILKRSLLFLSGLFLFAPALNAHHSTNNIYDESAEVELTGTVKQWRFVNPHPSLLLEVVNAAGETEEWDVSYGGSAVVHLARRGYSADTFKPGDEITVKGHPARLDTYRGVLMERNNPTRVDGKPLFGGQ